MGRAVTIFAVIPAAVRTVAALIIDASHIKFIARWAIVTTLLLRFIITFAIAAFQFVATYSGPEPPGIPTTLLSSPVTAFLGAGTAILLRVAVAGYAIEAGLAASTQTLVTRITAGAITITFTFLVALLECWGLLRLYTFCQ
jgi:hypothetical protein